MSESNTEKIKALVKIIRPEITMLSIFTVYIGALAADSKIFSIPILLVIIAVFSIAAGSQPFNDYFDYEIDKIIHSNRPLPKGILKPKTALYMGIILFSIGLFISFFINMIVFLFSIIGITLIVLYELVSKKTGFLGNFVVAFTSSISFMYGGAAVGNLLTPAFYAVIAFFIFLGREILLDVRDYEGDKKTRVSLPVRIGRKKASYLGIISLFICMFLLLIPGFYIFNSIWYLILVIPLLFTTIYASILPLFDVENAARTTDILRFSMIQGILIFVLLLLL